jgi:flagella basal body P-ring formation protein FlgA
LLFVAFCAFFFCLEAPAAPAARTLRVSVPPAVELEGEACALSDIAELDGPPDLTERAGALLLSVQDGAISREQVIRALQVSGLDDVRIELKMPVSVRAERPRGGTAPRGGAAPGEGDEKGKNEGEESNLIELIKGLAAWEGGVEASYRGAVPPGRLVSPASLVPGTAAATLRFREPSGRESSLPVRLAWTQPALARTRSEKRGEPQSESDLAVRQVKISRPGEYVARISEAAGRSVRKNISQGELLVFNVLEDKPIMEKGKRVTIVARSAGLVVRSRGEALESGSLGAVIDVRSLSGKTVVKAVVVGEDTVEVKTP